MSTPVLYLFNGKVASFGNAVFGFTPAEVYTVTISTVSHGTITASPVSGVAGTTITLTSTPDSGYELDYFTVNGVAIVGNSFTMPAENVTVGAVMEESPTFDEVTIGTQTWMAKNLAIDDGGEGIRTRTVNYGQGDVVEYFYTFDAAVRVAASVQGWHLPTKDELDALASYVGSDAGLKLKSTYGWNKNGNGTDEFGFTALPAGGYIGSSYIGPGPYTYFWSSTTYPFDESQAYYRVLYYNSSSFDNGVSSKSATYSLRLIKDT